MDFENVRAYIVAAGIVPKATLKTDTTKAFDAILLLSKPDEMDADTYLVYRFRRTGGNSVVNKYTFEIKVCSNEALPLIELKDKVAALLDFYCRPVDIEGFTKFRLTDEDGASYDDETGLYTCTLAFECNYVIF